MTILILIAVLLLFYSSYSIQHSIYLKSFCKNRAAIGKVALTFDDGVDPDITEKLLEILKKYDIKATFFIIGKKAEEHPDLVKLIVQHGHSIGNHSYTHSVRFTLKTAKGVIHELRTTNDILEKISGLEKIKYFRPPFGVTNPNIARAVKRLNMNPIGWSIRSLDTKKNKCREFIAKRVLNKLKGGDVILLHDNLADADKLTELIICGIHKKGYEIEMLDTLRRIK